MLPVSTAGLHCGTTDLAIAAGDYLVLPVSTAGLHCGLGIESAAVEIRTWVLPVSTAGLHCGN